MKRIKRMLSFMSDTFCWCVNGAWAYLSCVFYVVSDVSAAPTEPVQLFFVQIVETSPVTELLSRFNFVLRENWKKKDLSLFTRKMFNASLLNSSTFHWTWYSPSCIGDAFSRLCHIFWICPKWCSCCVPISFHLSHLWDDMSELAAWTGRHQRGWEVPNEHSCNREHNRWIHVFGIKKKMTLTLLFVSFFHGFISV